MSNRVLWRTRVPLASRTKSGPHTVELILFDTGRGRRMATVRLGVSSGGTTAELTRDQALALATAFRQVAEGLG